MLFKTIQLLHLLCYVLVTSQLLFYLVILGDALKPISIHSFLEQRKSVDALMLKRWKYVYYACLLLSLAMVILSFKNPSSPVFISSVIALICVVADVAISQKGNTPLNILVNSYEPGKGNTDWEAVRVQWLNLVRTRGIIITIGMVSLLAGVVLNQ